MERLLARGGMGEAFLARDPRTGDRVLLKLPAPEVLGDVAAHSRFEREGAALRRLDHPGVQRWIESGQAGLRPYVALEYVAGGSLRDVLRRRGRLPPDEAIAMARQLAEALAYCHAHGVVHRHLKPDNVILTGDGRPVLIDFGSVLLEGAKRLTFLGLSGELGTPEYMAPEQVTSASWSTALDEPQSWRDWARYVLVAVAALLCLVLVGVAAAYLRPAH